METKMFNILDAWREQRSKRKTHQRLHQLSDQILLDIGLTRADIASVDLHGRFRSRTGG
jgi:uncharacterized protein YjiS (DUF1127 family)